MQTNNFGTQNVFLKSILFASTILAPLAFVSCGQRGPQGNPGEPGNSFFPPTLDLFVCAPIDPSGPTTIATFGGSCFTNGQPLLLQCIVDNETYTNNGITCENNTWNLSFHTTSTLLDGQPALLCDILDQEHGIISPFETLSCE